MNIENEIIKLKSQGLRVEKEKEIIELLQKKPLQQAQTILEELPEMYASIKKTSPENEITLKQDGQTIYLSSTRHKTFDPHKTDRTINELLNDVQDNGGIVEDRELITEHVNSLPPQLQESVKRNIATGYYTQNKIFGERMNIVVGINKGVVYTQARHPTK